MTTKILDCTLRDGGYYNGWNFSNSFVKNYLSLINKLDVEYVEIGFRKKDPHNKFGKFFSISDNQIKILKKNKKFKIALMIDLADFKKDLSINELFKKKNKSKIDLVRIALNYEDVGLLPKILNQLNSMGYDVAINLMKATLFSPGQIIKLFDKIDLKKIKYFYIADSYGNCRMNFLKALCKSIKKSKYEFSNIGFHAHDNLKLAKKNALFLKNQKIGMIDTSVFGMGRGAGNLKLEDFIQEKKKNNAQKKMILNFIHKNFLSLKNKYKWGPNKYYKYAAENFIHPTYVQRLLEDKKFINKKVFYILKFLKKRNASKYDLNIFDNLFYTTKKLKNYKAESIFNKKKIHIILNSDKKNSILSKNKDRNYYYSILNYSKIINNPYIDLMFVSNPFRIITESKFFKKSKKKIILPYQAYLDEKIINKNALFYDFFYSNSLLIRKNFCSFKYNLVIVYALAFLIENNFQKIQIHGLTKNRFNLSVLLQIKNFIKSKKLKTKIIF